LARPAEPGPTSIIHGFNLVTPNVVRRHPLVRGKLAYAGAGLGVSIPHVEMQRSNTDRQRHTNEYQIAGPAV
jgi:hypothetical protein